MWSKKPNHHVSGNRFNISNEECFQWVYENHHLTIFRYIYGCHGGTLQDVEDLTTTTFLRAWKSRHRFHGNKDAAVGWLLRIARNLVIDTRRQIKRNREHVDIDKQDLSTGESLPEEQFSHRERIQVLRELLADLPEDRKEMLVLRYILGWRVKDIASHMDRNENSVSVTIRRTLKRLNEAWPDID